MIALIIIACVCGLASYAAMGNFQVQSGQLPSCFLSQASRGNTSSVCLRDVHRHCPRPG